MATATLTAEARQRRPGRGLIVAGVVAAWLAAWWLLRGVHTLELSPAQLTDLHRQLNEANDAIGASRGDNPVFVYFFDVIRVVVGEFATFVQSLIAKPSYGLPIPVLGWLGVVALGAYLSHVFANGRRC